MRAGELIDLPAEPMVVEQTRFYEAGVLRIGVEPRHITEDSIRALYQDDPANLAEFDRRAALPGGGGFDDHGVSIHIMDASTGLEHLRFDCFEDDPHYHYIFRSATGAETQRWIRFDDVANGDMRGWVTRVLTSRLKQMLREAGVGGLADEIDADVFSAALKSIPELEFA